MKLLLDIRDDKASFFMELLEGFSYVKAKPLTEENSLFLNELKEAIEDVKLVKSGKLKPKFADDFLDEL